MLAFQRARDRFEGGLLPVAAGLPIAKDFVGADDAYGIEMQRAPLRVGPEHEGRVAVRSPGDGDGAVGQ